MKNEPSLLVITASPRSERSKSRRMATEFISGWRGRNPEAEIVIRDLFHEPPSFVSEAWVEGAFGPEEGRSPAASLAMLESDANVDQLLNADEIVIATPMYNLSVPAVLKAWIDQVVRVGRTFSIGESGYQGLVTGKKVRVLVVSGGDFRAHAPAAGYNFLEPYLRGVLGFIGLTDIEFLYAVNQSMPEEAAATALAEGLHEAWLVGAA